MRNIIYALTILILPYMFVFTAGCGDSANKLKAAATAENGGDCRKAVDLFAAVALESTSALKLPEAQRGSVIQPSIWQSDMEKYIKWLTEAASIKDNALNDAINGLGRCVGRFESDNTFHLGKTLPFDTMPTFIAQWNLAFNPPPPGAIDWDGILKQTFDKKFSVLRISAGKSYTYDVSVISRKTSRRVAFTLYAESQTLVPLPPAEYVIVVKSNVEFQKGEHWSSENSAFNLNIGDAPGLIALDLRTKVAKK